MNDDYSEILNKFSDILKEKNIDLNNILGGKNDIPPNSCDEKDNFSFDINTILKIKDILNSMNNQNSSRNQLLKSLKPYLDDNKKEKLDQYIKIANLLSILETMDEKQSFKFLKNQNYDLALMLILFLLIL